VDADFAGLFSVEDGQQSIAAKSCTGYIVMYSGVQVIWVSKMQTRIALSTMEAKYIALSQSMGDLIPIREILKDITNYMFLDEDYTPKCASHSKASKDAEIPGSNGIAQSSVYEENEACLKFAQMPKLPPRTKHICIIFHWFRSKIVNLEIIVKSIDTTSQLGEQFTKGLPQESFEKERMALMGW
jgi:hypothetical protein